MSHKMKWRWAGLIGDAFGQNLGADWIYGTCSFYGTCHNFGTCYYYGTGHSDPGLDCLRHVLPPLLVGVLLPYDGRESLLGRCVVGRHLVHVLAIIHVLADTRPGWNFVALLVQSINDAFAP